MDECLQKRLLQHILRILPVPGDAIDPRQKFVRVPVLELHKRTGVAGLRRRNQKLVVNFCCFVLTR